MRVLIAPQELKGTLAAVEAAAAIGRGLAAAEPGWQLDRLPMADGGPGTAAALLAAAGGAAHSAPAHDALMRPIEAEWSRLASGVAVIECAAASGLLRLQPSELDPRRATTFGTGELVRAALDAGCDELILGLGGSATNDGGAGLAQALGFRLLDGGGRDLPPGGAALARLSRIDAAAALPVLAAARFLAATDVTNPLCGPSGAAAVYGPQKGADPAAVAELDAALARFAAVVQRDLGADIRDVAGAGAAGGLGGGAIAFLGAALRPGAALVGEAAGLEKRLGRADLVITAEGRLDGQTAFGKTPQHVARLARLAGRPVICLAGALGPGHERVVPLFDLVEVLAASPMSTGAAAALEAAAVRSLSGLGRLQRGAGL